jgi:outer membrane protein
VAKGGALVLLSHEAFYIPRMPLFKKIIFFILLSICLAAAADGMRIAHVDSKLIFEGYKGTKKAQEEYDRQVAKWEQQANLLQKELGYIKERLEKQSLMISDEQKRELEAEYARRDTELKKFIEKIYGRNGELLTENEKVSAPIIALIKKAVTEIALSEGYDYVLDRATGAVLFWKNENDLTQKVLDYLNAR